MTDEMFDEALRKAPRGDHDVIRWRFPLPRERWQHRATFKALADNPAEAQPSRPTATRRPNSYELCAGLLQGEDPARGLRQQCSLFVGCRAIARVVMCASVPEREFAMCFGKIQCDLLT